MRYLIGLIIAIAVIIFVIIRLLIGGGSNTPQVTPATLANYADSDTTVRYSIDNPVQAGENHRDIIIVVGDSSATITVTKGYQGEVLNSESYPTSVEAYRTFLLALDHSANFTKGNSNPAYKDERGYCATGNRYSYDIVDGDGKEIQHFWSTSCKDKTFQGDVGITQQLFQAQIPNFADLVQSVQY